MPEGNLVQAPQRAVPDQWDQHVFSGPERAKEPSFQTLAEEIGDLPVPVKLRMQILEVFFRL